MSQFDSILGDGDRSQDEKAEAIIALMVSGAIALAIVPAHINWALFSGLLGGGVVAIGKVYGVSLSGDDGWKLVKQFFLAAGFTFLALAVGSKIIAALLTTTGIGHLGAMALDSAVSGAIAYAVGKCGKAYFKGERSKDELGRVFRTAFKRKKNGEA